MFSFPGKQPVGVQHKWLLESMMTLSQGQRERWGGGGGQKQHNQMDNYFGMSPNLSIPA